MINNKYFGLERSRWRFFSRSFVYFPRLLFCCCFFSEFRSIFSLHFVYLLFQCFIHILHYSRNLVHITTAFLFLQRCSLSEFYFTVFYLRIKCLLYLNFVRLLFLFLEFPLRMHFFFLGKLFVYRVSFIRALFVFGVSFS